MSQVCFRSSRSPMFLKISSLKNFARFTGKHLCRRLFLNKIAGLRLATLLKARLHHRCFFVNFSKILRTPSVDACAVPIPLLMIYFAQHLVETTSYRSSHPGMFLGKGVLKRCSNFTGEHPCQSVISIKLHQLY